MNATMLALVVLVAAVAAQGQQAAPGTVRDHLWLFSAPADSSRLHYENAGYRGGSRITPVEAAVWFGVPNLLFITQDWNRPMPMSAERAWKAKTTKEQWAISFEPMKRVQWAAVGSSGRGGLPEVPDIVTLSQSYPNFVGIYLDDFVVGRVKRDGKFVGKPAMSEDELKSMREQLKTVGRPMEVWATTYTAEFDPKHPDFTDCDPPLVELMEYFDVLVLWTWSSEELKDLEKNLAALEAVKPKHCRIALGMYLWDYPGKDPNRAGDKSYLRGMPVPIDRMEHQCSLGLKWLKEGRVCDLVILGMGGIDTGVPTAPWMREWIRQHGEERVGEDRKGN